MSLWTIFVTRYFTKHLLLSILFLVSDAAADNYCDSPVEQPYDIINGKYDNMYNQDKHICARACMEGEKPYICYYKFSLELYNILGGACGKCPQVMQDCYNPQCVTADSYDRPIQSVNRMLPAPSIQVCKGDTVVVKIMNMIPAATTGIHWHGIAQAHSQWMDGVPMITQCPIMEGQTFDYRFEVPDPGTFFWHSHDGMQKVDGIVGSLVVREPDSTNLQRHEYDDDIPSHTILFQDWLHTSGDDRLPGRFHNDVGNTPDSYLIQGKGTIMGTGDDALDFAFRGNSTPPAYFQVEHDRKYLFRFVSGSCLSCPYRVSIQDHTFMVVGADDGKIEPIGPFDSIVMAAGERFNVVVNCNQKPGKYWLLVQGLDRCTNARQAAILQYSTAIDDPLPGQFPNNWNNAKKTFNMHNIACDESTNQFATCFNQVKNLLPNPPEVRKQPADKTQVMAFGFHQFSTKELYQSNTFHKFTAPVPGLQFAGTINNITNIVPASPLLTQYHDIPRKQFCPVDCDGSKWCECLNVYPFDQFSTIEFIICDTAVPTKAGLSHPFHIHSMSFFIEKIGLFKQPWQQDLERIKQELADPNRQIPDYLPIKDTLQVPSGGYAIVRIHAINCGFWLWHCHFSYHITSGMSAIIQIGPPGCGLEKLPKDFPKCNNFFSQFTQDDEEEFGNFGTCNKVNDDENGHDAVRDISNNGQAQEEYGEHVVVRRRRQESGFSYEHNHRNSYSDTSDIF